MTGFSARRLALGALAALTLAALPATAAHAAAARPAAATLSASPDSGLTDGQTVTVTASGYPTNASLDLVECVEDVGCDFSNLLVLDSGAIGGYTTDFTVHRGLNVDGTVVDCAAAQNCILVSLDISDLSTGAQTSIAFDPNAPFHPPVHFRLAPDATGHVVVDKGVARITGNAYCNQPVIIEAQLQLTQVWKRHIFHSYTSTEISCDHGGRFAAVFRPLDGLFGTGAARVDINAFGSTATSSYSLFKHASVTLQ
jgi:hypothetical protein